MEASTASIHATALANAIVSGNQGEEALLRSLIVSFDNGASVISAATAEAKQLVANAEAIEAERAAKQAEADEVLLAKYTETDIVVLDALTETAKFGWGDDAKAAAKAGMHIADYLAAVGRSSEMTPERAIVWEAHEVLKAIQAAYRRQEETFGRAKEDKRARLIDLASEILSK
jgi:hypothetical protein